VRRVQALTTRQLADLARPVIQHEARGPDEPTPSIAEAAFEMFYGEFVRGRPDPSRDLENIRDYAILKEVRGDPASEDDHREKIQAFGQRLNQPDESLEKLLQSVPRELITFAEDRRFVEIAERLGEHAELDSVVQRIGERLLPSHTADIRVTSATVRLVLEALNNPGYNFRTAEGIASDTGLPVAEVMAVINGSPESIRQSTVPDLRGRPLFAARGRKQR
jgi:hypothetical protein